VRLTIRIRPLDEPPGSLLSIDRLREHIALGQFAFRISEHFQLFPLFQAFGHHVHADVFRQRDDRAHDLRAFGLGVSGKDRGEKIGTPFIYWFLNVNFKLLYMQIFPA